MNDAEFHSLENCQNYIRLSRFHEYIHVKEIRMYRKISGTQTYFAKIIRENFKYAAKFKKYPTDRVEVYVQDLSTKDKIKIIEYLKNHNKTILGKSEGILEPYVFPCFELDDCEDIITSGSVYSFLDKEFAIEFKLTWG